MEDVHGDALEVCELVEDTCFGDKACMIQASESAHGEAAVLDLVDLVLLENFGVLAETERVEGKVARFAVTFQGLLECDGAENLEEGTEEENLGHASLLDEEVVGGGGAHGVDAWESEELREDDAEDTEHCDAACMVQSTRGSRDEKRS